FVGNKFCPHCGAELVWTRETPRVLLRCPRCRVEMSRVMLGTSAISECGQCNGIWLDSKTFDQICNDREQQATAFGAMFGPSQHVQGEPAARYVPCPVCNQIMNRINFAHRSGVVVDVCRPHGIWFDRDELRKIVEFIRAGGLDRARDEEKQQLDDARRELEATRIASMSSDVNAMSSNVSNSDLIAALGLAGTVIGKLLR